VDVKEFVLSELSPPPARLLEVGCGSGDLARALAAAGYDVLAIDPEAPEGPLFRRIRLEDLEAADRFDAVVASRSLHHVGDLAAAVEKMAAHLAKGGTIVIDEFGWERLDARSAEEVGISLAEWRKEHEDLHTAAAMVERLDGRFERRWLSWEPYLYREQRQAVSEEIERKLIETGHLAATGFRYVGVR
jgi:SAM-dependent methyltransferase